MAEGWFDINHSLLNSTLCSQRFSFSDDSECRLYPLCKEWSQVFSLHPCYWEFILLMLLAYRIIFLKSWRLSKSDWMLLARTEAGLMAEPLRPPPSSIPISHTKSLMDYQRVDLHDYRQYIQYIPVPSNQVRSKCTRCQKAWNFSVGRILRANTSLTK